MHIASKKKKIKRNKINENKELEVKSCGCPFELQVDKRYIIFSAKSLKKKTLKLKAKEQGSSNGTDAVIALSDAYRLGHVFQILFDSLES